MMTYTGERVIPKLMNPMNMLLLEHIARYQFSLPYARTGKVLDMACGSGFGTHFLAKKAKHLVDQVVGIDVDPKAIQYAKGIYYHPKAVYQQQDAADPLLPQILGQFDLILSFETIEHIENEQQFMKNIYDMLKPGGQLILSTPFGKGRGIPCGSPFHVHQVTKEEFCSMFDRFVHTEFYYQNGVLIEPERKNRYYPIGLSVCTK
ncbi:class I SAM-dependent methyltransferase [Bacillus atrophaeus]|uniref:class I SAM-dependent methyltransferase n=1 Tax=Bacillus atrophaeus TaxID=1452 RepID=UPI001EFA9886|nr:class I SAM-dependent methyltransferase [Bacillus atrophaeus]MCG8398127.1 class I SAM-dependent methyltransferase [Bacillus atrophaeus]